MRIFISWSGELSHAIALTLREWLPMVIQAIESYVSSEDIDKGAKWFADIAGELEKSDFGIVCLTRENLNAPWILFESGALSKSVSRSRVSPLLIDLSPSDLEGPLAQFQAVTPTKEDVYKLVQTINAELKEVRLNERQLQKSFDRWWPDLETQLNRAKDVAKKSTKPESALKENTTRTEREVLEEILSLTRIIAQSTADIGSKLVDNEISLQQLTTEISERPSQPTVSAPRSSPAFLRRQWSKIENDVLKSFREGSSPEQVIKNLVDQGLSHDSVRRLVDEALKEIKGEK